MGKSSNQIYMDYQAMKQRASRLEELARELRAASESTVACYSSNGGFWRGDSGDICRERLTKLENNLDRRARELEKAASAIRKTAERQYRLESTLIALVSR